MSRQYTAKEKRHPLKISGAALSRVLTLQEITGIDPEPWADAVLIAAADEAIRREAIRRNEARFVAACKQAAEDRKPSPTRAEFFGLRR